MTKEESRKYFLQKRLLLSEDDVKEASLRIFDQWKRSGLSQFNSFHIFLPIKEKKEVDTTAFIEHLWKHDKKVYCSKVENDHLLHYELTPQTQLRNNSWGIPEPVDQKAVNLEEVDCVFVPLLAYDLSGNRVGYGKGYYDRFLSGLPDTKKIGLSFFNPVNKIEDILTCDIPLNYILTPDYFSIFPLTGFPTSYFTSSGFPNEEK
ncbi:MAG: 5-formyltetrahydrofolate cyclo-ligase [Flavobacteriaceae bacterium]|jgi:5-formyltetrahydrofolate cyclo-ligase|nr:5-formyltetrahydrofolate cyclo-ligase [Flavobacteriaceae bacterium]